MRISGICAIHETKTLPISLSFGPEGKSSQMCADEIKNDKGGGSHTGSFAFAGRLGRILSRGGGGGWSTISDVPEVWVVRFGGWGSGFEVWDLEFGV